MGINSNSVINSIWIVWREWTELRAWILCVVYADNDCLILFILSLFDFFSLSISSSVPRLLLFMCVTHKAEPKLDKIMELLQMAAQHRAKRKIQKSAGENKFSVPSRKWILCGRSLIIYLMALSLALCMSLNYTNLCSVYVPFSQALFSACSFLLAILTASISVIDYSYNYHPSYIYQFASMNWAWSSRKWRICGVAMHWVHVAFVCRNFSLFFFLANITDHICISFI